MARRSTKQSVLISGIGVAGPTLAYWLLDRGFEPTLVERAPGLRTGGYTIDFWGRGYDVAEQMGLLPGLRSEGYDIQELRFVDNRGRRVGGFGVNVIRALADLPGSISRNDRRVREVTRFWSK